MCFGLRFICTTPRWPMCIRRYELQEMIALEDVLEDEAEFDAVSAEVGAYLVWLYVARRQTRSDQMILQYHINANINRDNAGNRFWRGFRSRRCDVIKSRIAGKPVIKLAIHDGMKTAGLGSRLRYGESVNDDDPVDGDGGWGVAPL